MLMRSLVNYNPALSANIVIAAFFDEYFFRFANRAPSGRSFPASRRKPSQLGIITLALD
jgi:hypothetical protein